MGGITTGVGLFSGIDTQSLINQLLQIDARPRVLAQNRVAQLQRQQSAFLGINSSLNSLRTSARAFESSDTFRTNIASSSNTNVLTATAGVSAPEGSFQFVVNRLVSTQQNLSRGFNDRTTSPVGATAFTFEDIRGSVRRDTELVELNGGNGIDRGKINISSGGDTVEVDLSTVVTLGDVISRINNNGELDITARVVGDGIILESTSGAAFTVSNGLGNDTASSLGIAGSSVGGELVGTNVRSVSELTPLSILRDGAGITVPESRTFKPGVDVNNYSVADIVPGTNTENDITIADRTGTQFTRFFLGEVRQQIEEDGEIVGTEVLQAAPATLGDVINIINATAATQGIGVVAGINDAGTGLEINDTTGSTAFKLIVKQTFGSSSTIVNDLGINTGDGGVAASTVQGERLISGLNSLFLRTLNGGSGINQANLTGTALSITNRAGANVNVNLSSFSASSSLNEIVEAINDQADGISVRAELNSTGNGIALVDSSGGGGSLIVGGDAAAELGLETAGVASNRFDGANLQARYIYGNTRLENLNIYESLGAGTIRITDASGGIDELSFTAANGALVRDGVTFETVDDLINFLQGRPGTDINIAINDTGDGLVFTDTSGGGGNLRIEDVTGSIARDLGFRGTSEDDGFGNQVLNGSLEKRVEFETGDTLDDVVSKINNAGVALRATVVNDGGGFNPFRINFTARNSGADGRVLVDTLGFNLGLTELSRGRDAVAFFGSDNPADGVLLTSSTNTLDNVITGVSIDLKAASTEAVELNISRDSGAIEEAVQSFVDAYNNVLGEVDKLDFFDSETQQRGVLLGDPTLATIRRQLFATIQGEPIGVSGTFTRLFQVGVRIGEGAELEFDRDRFRSALEQDPDNVEELFAARSLIPRQPIPVLGDDSGITVANTGNDEFSALGIAERIAQLADSYTDSIDGLLTNRSNALDRQIEVQESRIETLTLRLNDRRTQLEREFLVLEQSLAALSSQQSALSLLG